MVSLVLIAAVLNSYSPSFRSRSLLLPRHSVGVSDIQEVDVRVLDEEAVFVCVVEVDHVDALEGSCSIRKTRLA
jgi:hypothetical protein